jgi:hypothetical protein
MKSADETPSRVRLFWHLVHWELRRMAWPLAGWLVVAIPVIVIVCHTDWSWPQNQDEILWRIRKTKQAPVDAGMILVTVVMVYFAGELFIPLRPGVSRSRLAFPPRRGDALAAAFVILAIFVVLPFVFYYKGWVMSMRWYTGAEDFVRMFVPPVPILAAGLALVALLTGDWGIYLLTSVAVLLGLTWFDSSNWPRFLAPSTALLMTIASLAAAVAALHWQWRWAILAVWVIVLALCVRFL